MKRPKLSEKFFEVKEIGPEPPINNKGFWEKKESDLVKILREQAKHGKKNSAK